MTPANPSLVAAVRLRFALEQTEAVLVSPDIEGLLACEAGMQSALAELPAAADLAPAERAHLRLEVDAAMAALARCRRLGAALTGFVQLSLEAQGIGGGYGRSLPAFAGQTVDERI